MINIGKEWHWMDEITSIEDKLSGWGFDMDRLRASEGALFSLSTEGRHAHFRLTSQMIPPIRTSFRKKNGVIMPICHHLLLIWIIAKASV